MLEPAANAGADVSITSTTAGSSSQLAIAGPSAVRSMRAPREIASVRSESAATIAPVLRDHITWSNYRDDYKGPGTSQRNKDVGVVVRWRRKTGVRRGRTLLTTCQIPQFAPFVSAEKRWKRIRDYLAGDASRSELIAVSCCRVMASSDASSAISSARLWPLASHRPSVRMKVP